jgi:hypothetical protein
MDNASFSLSKMEILGKGSVGAANGNAEAMLSSAQIWISGCQEIGRAMVASAQARLERNMSAWKAIAGIKSVEEAMALQTQLTRTLVENVVAEAAKLADASLKLAEQTMVPITARVALATAKAPKPTV